MFLDENGAFFERLIIFCWYHVFARDSLPVRFFLLPAGPCRLLVRRGPSVFMGSVPVSKPSRIVGTVAEQSSIRCLLCSFSSSGCSRPRFSRAPPPRYPVVDGRPPSGKTRRFSFWIRLIFGRSVRVRFRGAPEYRREMSPFSCQTV